jgi:hypothetical protein
MTSHNQRRRQLAPGATVFKVRVFGPTRRPPAAGKPETCVCGVQFTRYWAHRQTGHHKAHVRAAKHTAATAASTVRAAA